MRATVSATEKIAELEQRVQRLEAALRDALDLAAVSTEGDPWYAQNAKIDTEAVFSRGRDALEDRP